MKENRIHLVANSHIDPVWLWDKYEGIDEVINTFRSACDRLDEYPELKFSASSACFYMWVEKYAPDVFSRIRKHIDSGRWEVTGGWWVEADTNLPSAASLYKSAEISKRYFREHLGTDTVVGFSPDTFGHPATLPKILVETGFKYYIFCRPGKHENPDIPSGVFYWDYEGYRVLCHRLEYHYTQGLQWAPVFDSAAQNPELVTNGVGCYFFGIGDHGGGPSIAEIEFLKQKKAEMPELRFSTCLEYFQDAESSSDDIPVVTGDLHMHAVGCYSVNRDLKQSIRHAESALCYTQRLLDMSGTDQLVDLDPLWKTTIFNEFHDIMPGSCAPSAAQQALAEMNGVSSAANDIAYEALKRISAGLQVECRQGEFRIINTLDTDTTSAFEIESWPYYHKGALFMDSLGNHIPIQEITPSVNCQNHRWLFVDTIPARGMKSYHFDCESEAIVEQTLSYFFKPGDSIETNSYKIVSPGMITSLPAQTAWFDSPISLGVIRDSSDTWSHGLNGYSKSGSYFEPVESAVSQGLIASFLISRMKYGCSTAELMFKAYNDLPYVDLDIKVQWAETQSILKLEIDLPHSLDAMTAQGPGGSIIKKTESIEEPLHGWISTEKIEILQKGAFAFDRIGNKLRITLVRSSLYALDDSWTVDRLGPIENTDIGLHHFKFRFFQQELDSDLLDQLFAQFDEPFNIIHDGWSD